MDITDDYTRRKAAAQVQVSKYKRLVNSYSFMRLGLAVLLAIAVYVANREANFTIVAVAGVVLLLCFAWLVSKQSGFEERKKFFENLWLAADNETGSMADQSNIYDNGSRFVNEKHYYTSDLDIFGEAGLFKLVNRSATAGGNDKLAQWLSAPADKALIPDRQQAVQEIAGKNDWKLDMQATLLFAKNGHAAELSQLFYYLKLPLNLPGEKWLGRYAVIAPYLSAAAITAAFFSTAAKDLAILMVLFNGSLVVSRGKYIKKTSAVADRTGNTLSNYAAAFKKIETQEWRSTYGNALAKTLATHQTLAGILALSVLINKLNYHLVMVVGALLNAFFIWDIRQVIAIERWKRANSNGLESAFDVIAEFEALISLSSLAINYPGWCFPQIAEGNGYTISAKKLAHPLINSKTRVENDYQLDNTFHIDIITGSNMAGKSTFLRTIGINTVLALAGAPVCAGDMQVSVITLISYMRIKDSLNESSSTFKAELDRLQMLLAAVDQEPKVFFLIDEMLRGTNSVDKYLGSKAVIVQLIKKQGVGLVATHDLQIARLEDAYPAYIRNFYFDIQIEDGEMQFDYQIKSGECKTFNAAILLKQIGIDVDAG